MTIERIFGVLAVVLLAACSSSGSSGEGAVAAAGPDAGDVGDAGPAGDGGPAHGGGKVSVTILNEGTSDATGAPITFGQAFSPGDVPSGSTLTATANGQPVPVQLDAKATNPDGSLRHGVVTLRMPSVPAGGRVPVTLTATPGAPSAAPVALSDLLASSFDAVATLNVGGTTYSASARDLLKKAQAASSCKPYGKECNAWLAGPELSSWVVSAPLVDAGGAAHPLLSAIFEVRAYGPAPVERVWVDVAIENTWTYTKPSNVTYDATIQVGGADVFTAPALTHFTHARWHKAFWWGGDPALFAELDSRYLQSTRAVPRYQADIHPTDATLNEVRQSTAPMDHSEGYPDQTTTGAQPQIGPLPVWAAAYVTSMDPRAFRWMLADDDGLDAFDTHWRDQATGMPVSIVDHPCVTSNAAAYVTKCPVAPFGDDRPPVCEGGTCKTPLVTNTSHHGSAGYVPYLVTGTWYTLEEMEFWADWVETSQNQKYRGYADGLVHQSSLRAQAWSLRTLGYAAWILPDASPMKAYFQKIVATNIAYYKTKYVDNPNANELGLNVDGSIVYPGHGGNTELVGVAPWQADFFTWSVANLADLGYADAAALLKYFARFQIGLLGETDYCWVLASTYSLQIEDAEDGPLYPDFAKVYQVNFPKLQGLACASQAMADQLSQADTSPYVYKPGEMTGYPGSPTGFPANLQIGAVGVSQSGLPRAAEAWSRFANRTTKPSYSQAPQFGLWPRNVP
jgi:hypothetical protein